MAIRNSAKGIVVLDGKILLNKCRSRLGIYYALPGGGQKSGETLPEALVRELLEETGLGVEPLRLGGVYEQVTAGRDAGSDHKIYFLFICRPLSGRRQQPTERDAYQLGCEWMKIEDAVKSRLFPKTVRVNLPRMLEAAETLYLGSERKR